MTFADRLAEPVGKKSKIKAAASEQQAELATPSAAIKDEDSKPNVRSLNDADLPKDHSEFYLIKSEPSDYSIDDLTKEKQQTTCWGATPRQVARA